MKGTLFTADFVRNAAGALKLIEVNTDTAIQSHLASSQLVWGDFINVLNSNSITDLHILYKNVQKAVADTLVDALTAAGSSINVTRHIEADNSIYPTVVEDAAGKFILRLAYDQGALLDSTYAAKDLNVYKLFIDGGQSDSIPGVYYSGSESTDVVDTLEDSVNGSNLADIALRKTYSIKGHDISFYKLGNSEQSAADRIAAAKNSLASDSTILTNYYVQPSATKASSVRLYQIVYGASLDIVHVGGYAIESLLDYPTALEVSTADAANLISQKHYSEFSVEGINRVSGISPNHSILRLDGGADLAPNAVVGDTYKSYFVNGAPDTDQYGTLFQWSSAGSEMPSGSYATGSVLISTTTHDPTNNSLIKITLADGGILRVGALSNVIVHQASSDSVRYVYASTLEIGDSLFDVNGSKVAIQGLEIEFLDVDADASTYEYNLEDTDTFIVSGSSIIIHNAPCFVAGTQIALSNGDSKAIEDVVPGDSILSFNHDLEAVEGKDVISTQEKEVGEVIKVTCESGKDVVATLDHPFFVVGKGYASFDSAATLKDSGLEVGSLMVGDALFNLDGSEDVIVSIDIIEGSTKVYNLDNIQDNKNFFANDFLVHNRYK